MNFFIMFLFVDSYLFSRVVASDSMSEKSIDGLTSSTEQMEKISDQFFSFSFWEEETENQSAIIQLFENQFKIQILAKKKKKTSLK